MGVEALERAVPAERDRVDRGGEDPHRSRRAHGQCRCEERHEHDHRQRVQHGVDGHLQDRIPALPECLEERHIQHPRGQDAMLVVRRDERVPRPRALDPWFARTNATVNSDIAKARDCRVTKSVNCVYIETITAAQRFEERIAVQQEPILLYSPPLMRADPHGMSDVAKR